MQAMAARRAPTLGEAMRGLLAFLLLVGTAAGVAAALVLFGERPAPPAQLPTWEDVREALMATEPPLAATRYVASMLGWAVLTYVAAVLLLRALAGTLVGLTRGAAWAQDLERLVDIVTVPWVKRGVSGGLMAALLVASLVKVSPELPRLSFGGGSGGSAAAASPAQLEAAASREAPAATAALAGGEAAPAAPRQEAPVAAPEAPAAAAPQQVPSQRQVELPAPVVQAPGAGQGQEEQQGGEETPQDLNVQAPGVRLPGKLQGR